MFVQINCLLLTKRFPTHKHNFIQEHDKRIQNSRQLVLHGLSVLQISVPSNRLVWCYFAYANETSMTSDKSTSVVSLSNITFTITQRRIFSSKLYQLYTSVQHLAKNTYTQNFNNNKYSSSIECFVTKLRARKTSHAFIQVKQAQMHIENINI